MLRNSSHVLIHGSTLINASQINRTSRGMDLLMERVASGAFHDSDELCDSPKCHPHTRIAVLNDIMQWVSESESTRDDFILWLFGPAGAGKSAIAKNIAEIAAERGMLIGSFFFSRTSPIPGRGTKDRLIATLAYQLALSVPETRTHIEDAIERDPAIFKKNTRTQMDTLLIEPFQFVLSTQITTFPKLIIIDGLDECNDGQAQVAILDAISRSFAKRKLPIIFLVVSRPELDLVASFNSNETLKFIHRRLSLDDNYQPDDDIRLFLSDKFERIRQTHPLRSVIPMSWPMQKYLETLVRKSSGQFIYAATVVRFVESNRHRPTDRLNIILGILPPGPLNPFAELDALYNHILSSVDDIQLTLHVLSLYAVAPPLTYCLRPSPPYMSPDLFLSLEQGDVYVTLTNLSSIVLYNDEHEQFKISHASLVDFLCDPQRSNNFYIDTTRTCTDFFRRTLHYIKGPHGIRAGDCMLFQALPFLLRRTPTGQLRDDILNFNFDAFVKVTINNGFPHGMIWIFGAWTEIIKSGLEDQDKKEVLDRCYNSFESRLKIYQSNWRLQLLLALTVANFKHPSDEKEYEPYCSVVPCRRLEILLEMDDHDLHLADQDALDLRHTSRCMACNSSELLKILSHYVDGDMYASVALHCMRFLSTAPDFDHAEWRVTCSAALNTLCSTLQEANTSAQLVQFISSNDVHTAVRNSKGLSLRWEVWSVDVHILAFLSRASVCINWRIISAIRQALGRKMEESPYNFIESDMSIKKQRRQRADSFCLKRHWPYK